MARLWGSGFELNTTGTTEWSATSGTPSIQTTTVRSGTYAMQISSLSALTAKYVALQFLSAEGSSNRYYRMYYRATTFPSAQNRIAIWNDGNATSSPSVYLTVDNSGVLRLFDEDGQITGTTTLSTGTWYCIEVHIDTTPAGGSMVVEARVDQAAAFASASNRNIATTNNPFWWLIGGNLNGENQTTGNWFFDDLAMNDTSGSFQTSWPGPGSMVMLKPAGNGDNSQWGGSDGNSTDNYLLVDDVTPDGATTYVEDNTSGQIDDYTIDTPPADVGPITVMQVGVNFALSSTTGADPDFVLRIKAAASGTVDESANISGTGSTTYFTNTLAAPMNYQLTVYDLPGASTTAWKRSDLLTTQIGIRESATDTHFVRVSALWLLVDYIPFTAYTQNNSSKANILVTRSQANSSKAALGNKIYTREGVDSLPSNDTNLSTGFTSAEVIDVATADNTRVEVASEGVYRIHLFKHRHTNDTDPITLTWEGQVSLAPSSAPVRLQIYNNTTTTWETLDTDNSSAADTDFELTGQILSGTGDYFDANFWVVARVYQ